MNCFTSAQQIGDMYGTGGPTNAAAAYLVAQQFFAGTPDPDAQMCVVRIGMSGARARVIGAYVCWLGTPSVNCETNGGVSQLTALQGVTNGSLNWTQDGYTFHVTGINLSGAASLTAVAATIQTAISNAYFPTAGGGDGANIPASPGATISTQTCSNIQGEINSGFLEVTAAPTACVYPGGKFTADTVLTILGQISGPGGCQPVGGACTPNSVGVYSISSPWDSQSLSPIYGNSTTPLTLNYSVLTVGSVGSSTDDIRTGMGLTGAGFGGGVGGTGIGIYGQLVSGAET